MLAVIEVIKIAARAAASGWVIGFGVGAVMGFWWMSLVSK